MNKPFHKDLFNPYVGKRAQPAPFSGFRASGAVPASAEDAGVGSVASAWCAGKEIRV